jgi:glycosyl transferase family 2
MALGTPGMSAAELSHVAATNLVFAVVSFTAAVALLLAAGKFVILSRNWTMLAVLAVNVLASFVTFQWLGYSPVLLMSVLPGLILLVLANRVLIGFSFTGRFLMAMHANTTLAGLLWGLCVVTTSDVGGMTRLLISVAFVFAASSLVIGLVQSFEQWEVLCRRNWLRPRMPPRMRSASRFPKVSLHVPAYSEPPALVMATLDALAQLRYPNFEVLVIDNNTEDPALWRPVEAHCQRLGKRFRFFHVDRLAGAKAGALNFALRHTAGNAELIAVIDSDYRVDPDFLAALVGYFDDPRMAFVQTPQAYRSWGRHRYLRMCNWEYRLVFATTLVSRNERMAAITVGTMGLIRRKVLEEVGGWAEWCVTEDSELAVRIHAAGYHSVYLNAIFGKGLIPERFADYKKQRFRWTYGPIQELRRHFRLFLPKGLALPSALTPGQKLHHLMHGLGALKSGLEFLLLPLGGLAAASMLFHREAIELPSYLLPTLAAAGIGALVLKWQLFRCTLSCSFKDMLGALVATMALDYVIRVASLAGLLTRSTAWRRTNKFRAIPLGLGAVGSAMPELLASVILLVAACLAASAATGITVLFSVALLAQGIQFLAAPFMAVLAEHGVRRRMHVGAAELTASTLVVHEQRPS